MRRDNFESQLAKILSNAFGKINVADTQCVMAYLASIPEPISNKLLTDTINDTTSNSIQDFKKTLKVKVDILSTDFKWMKRLIGSLPEQTAQTLKQEYIRRRMKYQNGRSANIWLRKRVTFLLEVCRSIPVPLHYLNSEKRRLQIANEWSKRCLIMFNKVMEEQTDDLDIFRLIVAVKQPADVWGFSPVLPDLQMLRSQQKQGEDINSHSQMIARAIARLVDSKWWLHQIDRRLKQYQEHTAIIIGKVRANVSPYVSNHTLQEYQSRKKYNLSWMQLMLLINEQYQLELPLIEAVKSSISNPHNRRVELMVRMRGFEELAKEQGFVGEFYTLTAPSKYHSWCKDKKGRTFSNSLYQGFTPHQTQQYLCKQWSKIRAKLERQNIKTFGFRVVEPHHDGTPHWHLLLFFKPEELEQARGIICAYTVEHDPQELNLSENFTPDQCSPRFDYKTMDPEKGSATGYIAKYIAKNIDGAYVDIDSEANCSSQLAAERVAAWASLWHIRQFQQIGGAPVTVWRELRRLKQVIPDDEVLEMARKAADSADWQGYIEANGGIDCKRCQRPVKLAKTINSASGRYDEDITKIFGVMATRSIQSRLDGWELREYGSESQIIYKPVSSPNLAFPLSSDSCAPWRSDNNCTPTIPDIVFDKCLEVQDIGISKNPLPFLSG
ncbi:replication endonuclease [Parashewanella curva]|uniref:Replication endonuclease n=1 Tax=Parashewanella curva TaxID=2338552 RepID=A0A3L8PV76_9GAMM|nr:replication endonuclease [Parashewanella curva]RLV57952.1 replication endonuclease [Parashewanella curva]